MVCLTYISYIIKANTLNRGFSMFIIHKYWKLLALIFFLFIATLSNFGWNEKILFVC